MLVIVSDTIKNCGPLSTLEFRTAFFTEITELNDVILTYRKNYLWLIKTSVKLLRGNLCALCTAPD